MSLLRFFKKSSPSSQKEQSVGQHARQGHPGQPFPKEWSSHPGPFLNRTQASFDQGQGRGGYTHDYPSMAHHYPQERQPGFSGTLRYPNASGNHHYGQGYPHHPQNASQSSHQPHFSMPSSPMHPATPPMYSATHPMYGAEVPLQLDAYAQQPQDSRYRDSRAPYLQGEQHLDHGPYSPSPSPSFQGAPPFSAPSAQTSTSYTPGYGGHPQGQSYASPYATSPASMQEDQGYGASSRFASHPQDEGFFQAEQDRFRGGSPFSAGDFREHPPAKAYVPKKSWFFGRKSSPTMPVLDEPIEENASFPLEPANASAPANGMDLKDLRFWDSHPHDDAMGETEEDAQEQKPLRFVFGIGILILFATFSWLLFRWSTQSVTSTVPHIQADPNPFKVRPDNPGGLVIPHQDKLVYGRLGSEGHQSVHVEHVLPPPEQPMQGGYSQPAQPMDGAQYANQGYGRGVHYENSPQQGYAQPQGYTQPVSGESYAQPSMHAQQSPQGYPVQEGQAYAQQSYAPSQEMHPGTQLPQQGYTPYREDIGYAQGGMPQGGYAQPQASYQSPYGPSQTPMQQGQSYGGPSAVGAYSQHPGEAQQGYAQPSSQQQAAQSTAYYPDNYPPQQGQAVENVQRFDMDASAVATPSSVAAAPSMPVSQAQGHAPQKVNYGSANSYQESSIPEQQPFSAPVFFKAKIGEYKTKQEATQKWQSLKKEQKDLLRSLNHAVVKETNANGKAAFVLYALGLQDEEGAKVFCSKVSGARYYKQ